MAEKSGVIKKAFYFVLFGGATAGLLLLAYKYIPSFTSAANTLTHGSSSGETSRTEEDQSVTQSSSNAAGTVKLNASLSSPKFLAAAGATLTVSATIEPSNVTNKNVIWAVSDSSKISLNKTMTSSGESQIITLVKIYDGDVKVTATSEADPTVKTDFNVYVSNFIDHAVSAVAMSVLNDGSPYKGSDWYYTTPFTANSFTTYTVNSGNNYASFSFGCTSDSNSHWENTTHSCIDSLTMRDCTSNGTGFFTYELTLQGEDATRDPYLAYKTGIAGKSESNPLIFTTPLSTVSNSDRYTLYDFGVVQLTGYTGSPNLDGALTDTTIKAFMSGHNVVYQFTFKKVYEHGTFKITCFDILDKYSAPHDTFNGYILLSANIQNYVAPSSIDAIGDKGF